MSRYLLFGVYTKTTMFASTAIVAVFLGLLNLGMLNSILEHFSILSTYILNLNFNKKVQFYKNTFAQLMGINGIFGYGAGLYGSQICITFAKGIIYDWNPSLGIYSYAIAPYAKAIRGIMTEWYTNTGILISSLVLGYPLVSYIALVAELGIIGLYLFLHILDKKYRNSYGSFIIMFLLLVHFDTYFEIPCVFILILIAENISNKRKLSMK